MASAFLLRSRFNFDHLRPSLLQLPQIRILTRSMGSGPRTFPGGLTKWQHKRMQEKLARQKAHRLLRTEKQLYLSRLRSGLQSDPIQPESESRSSRNQYMSSKDQIKALADQFIQPGAVDLWNEDDGPVNDPPKKLLKNPVRIPQLSVGSFFQKRGYSVGRKRRGNWSSEEESGIESESESESVRGLQRNPMFSTAAFREYNVKREIKLHGPREERRGWSSEIQQIRDEFRSKREIEEVEERWMEPKGESLLSKKRFCLFLREKNLDNLQSVTNMIVAKTCLIKVNNAPYCCQRWISAMVYENNSQDSNF